MTAQCYSQPLGISGQFTTFFLSFPEIMYMKNYVLLIG